MTNHDENSNNRDNKSSASPSSTPTISTAIATTPVKNSTTNTSTADLSYSPDLSPNVMVEKAVKNAMEEQKKQQEQQDKAELDLDLHLNLNLTASTNNDTGKNTDTSIIVNEEDNNRKRPQLEDIWSRHQKKGCNREEAIQETWKLMSKYVDELIQDGILAHQEWERAEQRLKILQEDCTAKGRELERLRASDQKTRESISVRQEIVSNSRLV